MGSEKSSTFQNKKEWQPLEPSCSKQLFKQKSTGRYIQKHIVEKVDPNDPNRENFLYDWRMQSKNNKNIIAILQMNYKSTREEQNTCYSCLQAQQDFNLIIYTQHLHKLYQLNPNMPLNRLDQMNIFKSIIQGVDFLSKKFQCFQISKQMIGYNSSKVGKVWINQNFAINRVQNKSNPKIARKEWQASIINSLIDICKMCTTQRSYQYSKFYNVIEFIKENEINSFEDYRKYFSLQFSGQVKKENITTLQSSNKIVNSATRQTKDFTDSNHNKTLKIPLKQHLISSQSILALSNNSSNFRSQSISQTVRQTNSKHYTYVPVVSKKIYPVSPQQRAQLQSIRNTYNHSQISRQLDFSSPHQDRHSLQKHKKQKSLLDPIRFSYNQQNLSPIQQSIDQFSYISNEKRKQIKNSIFQIPQADESQSIKLVDSMILQRQQQQMPKNVRIVMEQSIIIRGINQ